MFKKTWDLALIQDLEDRKGTDIDFLRSFRTQLIPAQARAQDELLSLFIDRSCSEDGRERYEDSS